MTKLILPGQGSGSRARVVWMSVSRSLAKATWRTQLVDCRICNTCINCRAVANCSLRPPSISALLVPGGQGFAPQRCRSCENSPRSQAVHISAMNPAPDRNVDPDASKVLGKRPARPFRSAKPLSIDLESEGLTGFLMTIWLRGNGDSGHGGTARPLRQIARIVGLTFL